MFVWKLCRCYKGIGVSCPYLYTRTHAYERTHAHTYSGHRPTFEGIQYGAAFVGIDNVNSAVAHACAFVLTVLNTLGAWIFVTIACLSRPRGQVVVVVAAAAVVALLWLLLCMSGSVRIYHVYRSNTCLWRPRGQMAVLCVRVRARVCVRVCEYVFACLSGSCAAVTRE